MTTTERLITDLTELVEHEGSWAITSDELADRYDAVDLYRATYEASLVSVDRFDAENVGELLVLLDHLTHHDYRLEFRDAGLFLTHDDRIELAERFVRIVRVAIVVHVPEPETFRAMLRDFKRYDRAEFAYLRNFFDLDLLAERCVDEYLDLRHAPALRATIRSYLHQLVVRHMVDLHMLAPALMELLRTVARHEGLLPGEPDEREAGARGAGADRSGRRGGGGGSIDDRDVALHVLGLRRSASLDEIRSTYRQLMRRYHPDINPEGLEMAKRITSAYGILASGG